MSDDDVYPGEMDAPHGFDFDEQAAEALVSGSDRATEPQLSDLFDDMRVAYTSQPPAVGAELAAVLAEAEITHDASPTRRFGRMRSSLVARAGAAVAAVVAATGGLAVAHALPAPMQDAASDVGIGAPAHHGHHADDILQVTPDDSTTTTIEQETTTVPGDDTEGVEPGDDARGAAVGDHQGDNDDQGENACEADDQGEDEHGAVTSTTVACVPTTETTVPESHDGNDQGDNHDGDNEHSTVSTVPEAHDGEPGSSDSSGSGDEHSTTPSTSSPGGDSHSGSGDSGSSHD
jgi:hypothetical protein